MNRGIWLLTVAMEAEAGLLIPRLHPSQSLGGRPCFQGDFPGGGIILVLTGLGPVNAAQAAAACLERRGDIGSVLNLGCAGAYAGSGLEIGEAAIARGVVLADMGVRTRTGLKGLDVISIPLLRGLGDEPIYNRMPVDRRLSGMLARANPGIKQGLFATVGQVSGDEETAGEVEQRWGAALEEMEAGAVAQVSAWYRKPFAALRGVSNYAGDRQMDIKSGAEAAQRAFLSLGLL